eukprot:1162110-Pelagomonas_calceolata.AAC.5
MQDEEDAKRGLYNHFADSKLLLTLPRMLLGTVVAVAVPFYLLSNVQAVAVCLTVVAATSITYAPLTVPLVACFLNLKLGKSACFLVLGSVYLLQLPAWKYAWAVVWWVWEGGCVRVQAQAFVDIHPPFAPDARIRSMAYPLLPRALPPWHLPFSPYKSTLQADYGERDPRLLEPMCCFFELDNSP